MEYLLRYTGKVTSKLLNKEYDGFFYSNSEGTSSYIIIRYSSEDNKGHIASTTVLPRKFEQLTLKITDSLAIQMISCTRFNHRSYVGGSDDFSYSFEYSLVGSPFAGNESQPLFDGAVFEVPGILSWGNRYVYKRTNDFSNGHLIDIDYSAVKPVTLFENEYYSIEYKVEGKDPWNLKKESLGLYQIPILTIKSSKGFFLNQYIEIFDKVVKIIQLSMGFFFDFSKVNVYQTNSKSPMGKNDYKVDVYRHLRSKDESEETVFPLLFTLNDLIEKANLKNWIETREKLLRPIVDLYSGAYEQDAIQVTTYFLNICQALESYYARSICNDKRKFIKRVESETAEYSNWKDFIIKAPNYRNITLSERLADLLFCKGRVLRMLSGPFAFSDFPKRISDTRNYLTHYDIKKKNLALEGEDLSNACLLLKRLLEYYLLLEIGFSEDFVDKAVRKVLELELPSMGLNKQLDEIDKKNFPKQEYRK